MNGIYLKVVLLILVFSTLQVKSQDVNVKGTREIKVGKNVEYSLSGTSPDGKYLLVSGQDYKGLSLLNIRSRQLKLITDKAGAGYEPEFSADGNHVFFRTDDFSGPKRMSAISDYEVSTARITEVLSKGRNVTPPSVSGSHLHFITDGTLKSEVTGNEILKSSEDEIFVLVEDLTPVLFVRGERRVLKPSGDGAYIWVSLSPDKTMLLYCYKGLETYISDLEGRIIHSVGSLRAARWLTDKVIIGMDDKDDGDRITSSELVSYSLNSKVRKSLTSSRSRNEMYPIPFTDGKRVAFQTSDGELFIMKLRIK